MEGVCLQGYLVEVCLAEVITMVCLHSGLFDQFGYDHRGVAIYIYCKLFHQGVMPPLGYVCQARVWEVWLVELPGCDVIVQP